MGAWEAVPGTTKDREFEKTKKGNLLRPQGNVSKSCCMWVLSLSKALHHKHYLLSHLPNVGGRGERGVEGSDDDSIYKNPILSNSIHTSYNLVLT